MSNGADPDRLYLLLGVDKGATTHEITKAYKKKSIEHHPDKAGQDSMSKMQDLSEAHANLSDPAKRRAYDRTGLTGMARFSFRIALRHCVVRPLACEPLFAISF